VDGDTGLATIQTFTGRFVAPLDLREEQVDVADIAHALSNVCRFTGHTIEFYSVAQHSYIVSLLVPQHKALSALMHDSPEAYVCDLAGPLKRDTEMGRLYKELELSVADVIESALRLSVPFDDREIKVADWAALQVEGRCLMPPNEWARIDILPGMTITPMSPREAEAAFLARYEELSA
jgi:uncharacterized protein